MSAFWAGQVMRNISIPRRGSKSYFISFDEGPTLELMSRADVQNTPIEENRRGLTHLAFTFPSKEEILRFTEEMRSEGYTIAGEPRTSGDGYFESVVLEPRRKSFGMCIQERTGSRKNRSGYMPEYRNETSVLLRPFQENDAEAFFACCQNPNLGNNAGWAPHKTLNESREILHGAFIGQEGIWAVTLKDTQQLIASIGIVPDPKRENPQVRMLDIGWTNRIGEKDTCRKQCKPCSTKASTNYSSASSLPTVIRTTNVRNKC